MAEALGAVTHEFRPVPIAGAGLRCDYGPWNRPCDRTESDLIHRTPAVVQAALDTEATP
jgi:hypothetical protein